MMKGEITSSGPDWRAIVATSVIATVLALVVLLGTAAILMALTIGGFVVIVLIATDAHRLATIVIQALILVGPITLAVLPTLTLLRHRRPHLLRWLLLPAGPLIGGWWGGAIAPWWFADGDAMAGFLAAIGMIGGLTGGIVFVRRLPHRPERSPLAG
jgi:hypothetical protein